MARISYSTQEGERPKKQYDPVPPGTYLVDILSEESKTDDANRLHVVVRMRVLTGRFANRNLWDRLFLDGYAPRAREIAEDKLRAFGAAVGEEIQDTSQMVGRQVRVRVNHEDWNGKTQERIAEYLPPPGNQPDESSNEPLPF